jgi:predicted HicB family RNase H-like nuclease
MSASQEEHTEKERIFNLRVPESLVAKVDALRKRRTGKISRNTWILEAIEDKVESESVRQGIRLTRDTLLPQVLAARA